MTSDYLYDLGVDFELSGDTDSGIRFYKMSNEPTTAQIIEESTTHAQENFLDDFESELENNPNRKDRKFKLTITQIVLDQYGEIVGEGDIIDTINLTMPEY